MARNPDTPRNVAVGCFMVPLGAASGAMVGVLLSKIFAYFAKAPVCADVPTCDWYVYAGIGMLVGALTLPLLVVRQLLRGPKPGHARGEPASVPDVDESF